MNRVQFTSIFISMLFLIGCGGQLAVKQTIVEPPQLTPGKTGKIIVIFSGPKNEVAEVVATVREAPNVYYTLNNSGENGDEKAGDNIWTCEAVVPWDAPADTYHLDIQARDEDGNEIITNGLEQQEKGRSGTVEVIVK